MPNGNAGSPTYIWDAFGVGGSSNGWIVLHAVTEESNLPGQMPYPTSSGGGTNRVTVTVPQSSSPSVTQTTIYRTAVNGSALKQVANVAKGTTSYVDAIPDASLGAAPPATDSSLLREDGQLAVGATSALVTDVTPFVDDGGAAGGWALVGNLTVRYGGISGSQLTGIPAYGTGSITATVRYGAQVLVQPRLVGVTGLSAGARKGDTVTLRLEIEDQAAALAFAQRLGSSDYRDGLIEFLVSDSRFGPTELVAYMQATLTERKDPQRTVTYHTRDTTHEVGRLVTITIDTPPINGTFRIQRVAFSEIAIAGARTMKAPKRTVQATNKLFTFADILRQLRGREAGIS
jgi:hypothetical protein